MPQLWHIGTMPKPGDLPNPEAAPVGTAVPQAQSDAVIEVLRLGPHPSPLINVSSHGGQQFHRAPTKTPG
jgi:hypothetical protein